MNYLNYLHDTFINVKEMEFVYRNSNLDILFSLLYNLENGTLNHLKILYLVDPGFTYSYVQRVVLRLPCLKLCIFSHNQRRFIVIEAFEVEIYFSNLECRQIGKWIILESVEAFIVKNFSLSNDKNFIKGLVKIKNLNKFYSGSFIAFENTFKITSPLPLIDCVRS